MKVIYEQDYDVVSIIDIIEDSEFDNFINYYKEKILRENEKSTSQVKIKEIIDVKIKDDSVNFKIEYVNNIATEWYSFYYETFDETNKFIKNKNISYKSTHYKFTNIKTLETIFETDNDMSVLKENYKIVNDRIIYKIGEIIVHPEENIVIIFCDIHKDMR